MRHEIRGKVVDTFTGDAIGGVRVEAWDKDFGLDDFLGSASTKSDGSFTIVFDEAAFRELFFDNWPDIYFKVYCYNELLVSTKNSVLWNVRNPQLGITIQAPHPKPSACVERRMPTTAVAQYPRSGLALHSATKEVYRGTVPR